MDNLHAAPLNNARQAGPAGRLAPIGTALDTQDMAGRDDTAPLPPWWVFRRVDGAGRAPSGISANEHSPASPLDERTERLLSLVNGLRSVAEFRDLLPRYAGLDSALRELLGSGRIELGSADSDRALRP